MFEPDDGTSIIKLYPGDVSSVEQLVGSTINDHLEGHPYEDNVIMGLDGNDDLYGRGGKNQLVGGAGHNQLKGAPAGKDIALYPSQTTLVSYEHPDNNDIFFVPVPVTTHYLSHIHVRYFRLQHLEGTKVRHTWKPSSRGQTVTYNDHLRRIHAIVGSPGNDDVNWTGHDETFVTGGGRDKVYMNGGNDTVIINVVPESGSRFSGGADRNTLKLDFESAETVYLDLERHSLKIGRKTSKIWQFTEIHSSRGNDHIYGNRWANTFIVSGGQDHIRGRQGNDLFLLAEGSFWIHGGDGQDSVNYGLWQTANSSSPAGLRFQFELTDSLCPEDGVVYSGSGMPEPVCSRGYVYQDGQLQDTLYSIEHLVATDRNDEIYLDRLTLSARGGKGSDHIHASGGNDQTLFGDEGDDFLYAASGTDGSGSRTIAGAGYDIHFGSAGADTQVADIDADLLQGMGGADTYWVYLGATGSDIVDSDQQSRLHLAGKGLTIDQLSLSLSPDFNVLTIHHNQQDFVRIDLGFFL